MPSYYIQFYINIKKYALFFAFAMIYYFFVCILIAGEIDQIETKTEI